LAAQKPPSLTNPRLATAMAHPTRLNALRVVAEGVATPREIATEIGEPLNNVAYHVKVLAELGCIELVRVDQSRGGRVAEHFYKATQQPYFDDEAWKQLGDTEKLNVVSAIMHQISVDIADAMSHGTFCDPDDGHLSRTPLVVDLEGWKEVNGVLDEALGKLLAVKENVASRSVGSGHQTFPVKVNIMHFRSPAHKSENPPLGPKD
jgi:DNA-binding transcriptional ArsR family regulator